jgi:hypothetical protein
VYYYKIKGNNRVNHIPDEYIRIDPFKFFSPETTEHWSHKIDGTEVIDLWWPILDLKEQKV